MDRNRKLIIILLLHQMFWQNSFMFMMLLLYHFYGEDALFQNELRPPVRYSLIKRMSKQNQLLHDLVDVSDTICINLLRMDRVCFNRLCKLLHTHGGLEASKYVSIREQVAIFLNILAHHTKIRVIGFHYLRSYDTISRYFKKVLRSVMLVHRYMLVTPTAVDLACDDRRWEYFQGCLGALDGTYVDMLDPAIDKPRYRSRKGGIATKVLAVCDSNERFVYLCAVWMGWFSCGWEGFKRCSHTGQRIKSTGRKLLFV